MKKDEEAIVKYPYNNPAIKSLQDSFKNPLSSISMENLHTKHNNLSKEFS